MADLLHVPFAPAINHEWYRSKLDDPWCWPRLLGGPSDGHLTQEECEALASLLKLFTLGQSCFFRFSDIPFYTREGPQLFVGDLDEVAEIQNRERLTFEYWWPMDRSWCVCSDYDLQFTIVGGPTRLVSELLRDEVLECLEVTPDTRVDMFAPMPESMDEKTW